MSGRGNKKQSLNDPNKIWLVGIYARRSFDDLEDRESNTILNQKEYVKEYIKSKKNTRVVDYYIDDGYTGTNFDRPGFQQMMIDIKNGRINSIAAKDLSRFGRNHLDLGKYFEQIFPLYSIRIIAINDDVDSVEKPETINNFIIPLKNLINESYSMDISRKVASSYLVMAKKGKFVSGIPPYGYQIDPNDKHHLIINEEEAKVVREIFHMAVKGEGRIKICKYLNDNNVLCRKELKRREKRNISLYVSEIEKKYNWSTSSIGRMLSNETYIGNLVQLKTYKRSHKEHREIPKPKNEWIKCKNTHEPIIDEKIFYQVQENINNNRNVIQKKEKEYSIYNKILKCADCGKAMVKQEDKRGNRNVSNYYCMTHLHVTNSCSSHKIKSEELDKIVLETIQQQIRLVIDLERSIKKLIFKSKKYISEVEYDNQIKLIQIKINNNKKNKSENYKDWKLNKITVNEYSKNAKQFDFNIKQLESEMKLITENYKDTIKRIRKDDYWINHFKRNRKIKRLSKEILNELIQTILITKEGNVIIIFKYRDEYKSLLEYKKREEATTECINGNLVSI